MSTKKVFCIALAAALLLTLLPLSALANEGDSLDPIADGTEIVREEPVQEEPQEEQPQNGATPTSLVIVMEDTTPVIDVSDEASLRDAVQKIKNNTPVTINLTADIELSDTALSIPSNRDITLTGHHTLFGANNADVISLGGKLTLDGITVAHREGELGLGVRLGLPAALLIMKSGVITGHMGYMGDPSKRNEYGSAVSVLSGAFKFEGGSITGNSSDHNRAASPSNSNVHISSSSTINMTGGEISGNIGHGLNAGKRFEMTGGKISDNSGFGVVSERSNNFIFEMYDGEISGNGMGGVRNFSNFYMFDGVISGNAGTTGGGVHNGNKFYMYDGEISGNSAVDGGGVYNDGTYTYTMEITNGKIYNNTASGNGGGIGSRATASSKSKILINDSKIFDNSASGNGGGVFFYDSAAVPISNSYITGNSASGNGSGVYLNNYSILSLSGSSVTGNSTSSHGGGVYLNNNGTLSLSESVVADNFASGNGGGVYMHGTFNMASGEISGNTAGFNGGGLFFTDAAKGSYNINGGEISGNKAGVAGGGLSGPLNMLNVGEDAVFSGNTADKATGRNAADDTLYSDKIKNSSWTAPLSQGYNNFDISYPKGVEVSLVTVSFNGNGAPVSYRDLNRSISPGESLGSNMISNPVKDGSDFKEWNDALNGSGESFDMSTVVSTKKTVYAQWSEIIIGSDNIDNSVEEEGAVGNTEGTVGDTEDAVGNLGGHHTGHAGAAEKGVEGENSGSDNTAEESGAAEGTEAPKTTAAPPLKAGNSHTTTDNGNYIELDPSGVPLGEWNWNGEEWVFFAYAPENDLPRTGEEGTMPIYIFILFALGAAVFYGKVYMMYLQRKLKANS